MAAGWIPLVVRFYGSTQSGPRAVALLAAAGALLIMLRPPLPAQVTPSAGPQANNWHPVHCILTIPPVTYTHMHAPSACAESMPRVYQPVLSRGPELTIQHHVV